MEKDTLRKLAGLNEQLDRRVFEQALKTISDALVDLYDEAYSIDPMYRQDVLNTLDRIKEEKETLRRITGMRPAISAAASHKYLPHT